MAWEYSEKVKELFNRAVTQQGDAHLGELEHYDARGENGSIVCGDAITFYFAVEKNADPWKERIVKASYKTFGCTSAIASSEALCILLEENKPTIREALTITNNDIVKYLGGLPEEKIHCSVMGEEVLRSAILDWCKRRNIDPQLLHLEEEDDSPVVCHCFNLRENYLIKKINELKLTSVEEITHALKAGGACGKCKGKLQKLLGDQTKDDKELLSAEQLQDRWNSLSAQISDSFDLVRIKNGIIYLEIKGNIDQKSAENLLRQHIPGEFVIIFI